METYPTRTRDAFVSAITGIEEHDEPVLTPSQAEQLWDVWEFRTENGSEQSILYVPGWFTENEFEKRRPFLFVTVEYDNEDKNAVLFSDAWFVDISIIENEVWNDDSVTIDHTLERLDISEDDDYIDEEGKTWVPRSLCTHFEGGPV